MAAAIASARIGIRRASRRDRLGRRGQLTAQGLNASDDSRFTDTIGSTRTTAVSGRPCAARTAESPTREVLGGAISAPEPKVALDALEKMTKSATTSGKLSISTT